MERERSPGADGRAAGRAKDESAGLPHCALCGMPRSAAGAADSASDPMKMRSQSDRLRKRLAEAEAGRLRPGDVPTSALCALCAEALSGSEAADQPLARRIEFAIERLDMQAGAAESSSKPTT